LFLGVSIKTLIESLSWVCLD